MMFSSPLNIGNAGFWVANAEGLDEFDRMTATVKLHVPLQGASSGFSFYENRFETFWIYHLSPEPPAVFDRTTNTLTRFSFQKSNQPSTDLTGVMECWK